MLHLAHYYQISDLVGAVAAALLNGLHSESAVETARAMKILADDSEHAEHWHKFCELLRRDPDSVKAVALAV